MKVLVLPRDANPYQGLLYGEMQRLGVQVIYLGELTPIQTLNVLLLPLEVMARRLAGARVQRYFFFGNRVIDGPEPALNLEVEFEISPKPFLPGRLPLATNIVVFDPAEPVPGVDALKGGAL